MLSGVVSPLGISVVIFIWGTSCADAKQVVNTMAKAAVAAPRTGVFGNLIAYICIVFPRLMVG
jgi:hypothetical protein